MCGIYAALSTSPLRPIAAGLESRLRNRGPDHLGTVHAQLDQEDATLFLLFKATVLALRGDHIAAQPIADQSSGSVLCWNGEAWKIRGQPVVGNDGEDVMSLLTKARRRGDGQDHVLDVLRSIEGPFAFIYFDKPARRLYYGRDRLGRRSLLIKADKHLVLSSVAESPTEEWSEVEADGCYSIPLDQSTPLNGLVPAKHAWVDDEALVSSIGLFNDTLPGRPSRLTEGSPSVEQLRGHLTESLRPRLLNIPLPPRATSTDARIAVLFSGGLDCTVLARLASEILPPDQEVDLINVAFENPRIASQHRAGPPVDLYELCPDRITGRRSFVELLETCPDRQWRFVTVNVPYAVTREHRDEVIRLIFPHNTEMDLSIGYALYFAARGEGLVQTSSDGDTRPYNTTARVLLSGLGADELFGGYGRHGVGYRHRMYPGLIEELKLDVRRLGKRNLGRDDRVMSHWGREVRFPYLDEAFVKWAIECPVWEKCDFENEVSEHGLEPEKRVLRLLARELGMGSVAAEKKRAIQFGARTAKMESGKTKGTTLITA